MLYGGTGSNAYVSATRSFTRCRSIFLQKTQENSRTKRLCNLRTTKNPDIVNRLKKMHFLSSSFAIGAAAVSKLFFKTSEQAVFHLQRLSALSNDSLNQEARIRRLANKEASNTEAKLTGVISSPSSVSVPNSCDSRSFRIEDRLFSYFSSNKSRNGRQKRDEKSGRTEQEEKGQWGGPKTRYLLASLSMWATFKHMIGYEKILLDEDPIKARIKQAWISRKYGKYQEAADTLHLALEESSGRADQEMVLTRIYDELANTYLEWGKLEEADKLFREVLARLVHVHKRKDQDPEFIGISLKLADIFAQKGDYINAEIGFVHCLEKQEGVVKKIRQDILNSVVVFQDPGSEKGGAYTDPVALLGMVLEGYAHFLLAIPADKEGANRFDDSELLAFRSVECATEIYGPNAEQTLNVLNNYGVRCLMRNRFETAARFLRQVVRRCQLATTVEGDTIAGYYTNCAEAVFHAGQHDEALGITHKLDEQFVKHQVSEFSMEWNPNVELSSACGCALSA